VLLIVCWSTISGCATTKFIPCEIPELKGDTIQDVLELSVEQADALEKCNIRNGAYDYVTKD